MNIDMNRTYTADEIQALDLPEYTALADRVDDMWVRRDGVFLFGELEDTWNCEPFRILHIPGQSVVESPPEVDWATDDMVWVRTWVAFRPNAQHAHYVDIRHPGNHLWATYDRQAVVDARGIPADQLPPHQPAWPSPHGVTIEQAREIAAALEQFESES